MKKLRIVFYTDSYLPSVDGVVTSILNTRKELERRGHEVYVFTAGTKETKMLQKKDKHLVVMGGVHFRSYPQYTIAMRPEFQINIQKLRPDILHFHTPFSMGFLAQRHQKFTDAKLVSTLHTLVFSEEVLSSYLPKNKFLRIFERLLLMRYLRWIYRKSDAIIAPSQYVKRLIKEKLHLKNFIEVIPSGICLNKIKKVSRFEARKKLGIKNYEKILLYFGRVSPEKNLKFLIKAAKLFEKKDFRIIIAGGGPYLEKCVAMATKLNLKNVSFPGFIPEDLIKYYYGAADVFCNPSLFETLSLVDIEAMARGLPILVPDHSAQAEFLLHGRCGEVFDRRSKKDMVKKAIKIFENCRRYSTYKVAEMFSVKTSVDKILHLYYSLLKA